MELLKEAIVDKPADLAPLAAELIMLLAEHPVCFFYGPIGAGKTTFVQAICAQMGVQEEVTSPSYALVNTYVDKNGQPIYHLDLYRLQSAEEAWQIGVEEYLYGDGCCFVEWPELIESLLNDLAALVVKIDVLDSTRRKISIFET
ncbi:MAG: tRNA (adenosine(37)-N6)-threonylcarbamoyltransferase complex ATPase subunit type 1 TsaE [Lewinella sp.]|nr:tRNA (adenosine(37)-N6)-threonylcarbamoyltransferase complex ATPase subunit type 1 TsaE [Lewinella sp.]